MKNILSRAHRAVLLYAAWAWPLLILDLALGAYKSQTGWAVLFNTLAFTWVIAAAAFPVTLVFDKVRRERAMARLCGLREGDERERLVSGEAARATLLLGLALQTVLLVMSLTTVQLSWDPAAKARGEKGGVLSVGMGFSSERHLDPFASTPAAEPAPSGGWHFGGYLLAPSSFPVLAVLILVQLAAFRGYAWSRYEGAEN